MATTYHTSIDIAATLANHPNPADYKGMLRRADGAKMTGQEIQDHLRQLLADGKKQLCLDACDNFDDQTGCRGHQG
jgi:hypothetical protein